MPSLKVEKQCKLSPDDSFKRISELLTNDRDLRKLDPEFKAEFDPKSRTGTANGSMFKAKMSISETQGGSRVELLIDLPFHLALAKGMVEKTLRSKLEEVLA